MVTITYRSLDKINFPAYLLPSDNVSVSDGIVFVDGIVVDDRNMKGKSLGMRRLQTPHRNLLPLKKCVNSFNGVIKNRGNLPYMDMNGTAFIYEKTLMVDVKYHKIRKVEGRDTNCVLWLKDIPTGFDIPRPPQPDIEWAGVIYFHGLPWKLYEYSETAKKNRKIKI